MFESIEFKNFKALRDTTLPLSRFTLIVGPNGSGKSTALQAFSLLRDPDAHHSCLSVGAKESDFVSLTTKWRQGRNEGRYGFMWQEKNGFLHLNSHHPDNQSPVAKIPCAALIRARHFSLDATAIAAQAMLQPEAELTNNGTNLAVVLDRLRDQNPERFEAVNTQLAGWIPEFDRILFETPAQGHRAVALRTRKGGYSIKANQLSQGTLIALALLTIASLPEPPSVVCLEEPDHGLHPRLLRDVKDALYRLAYPDSAHEEGKPVQVIATTHNPFFLDLFREHPEEIVIAEKVGLDSTFSRLSDRKDLDEILGDASLSEVWYSGVLGGVPAGT